MPLSPMISIRSSRADSWATKHQGDGPALFTVDGNNTFDIVYVLETLVQKLVGLQRITIFVVRIEVVATSQENDTSARFEDLQMYRERTVFFMPVIGIVAESVHIFI